MLKHICAECTPTGTKSKEDKPMLLFSAVLSINDTLTQDKCIELVIQWNQGSRKENVIPGIQWNGERNIRFGNDKLWLQKYTTFTDNYFDNYCNRVIIPF